MKDVRPMGKNAEGGGLGETYFAEGDGAAIDGDGYFAEGGGYAVDLNGLFVDLNPIRL